MDSARIQELKTLFATELRDSILPFWLKYGVDEKYGGIIVPFDRDSIEDARQTVMQFLKEKASV